MDLNQVIWLKARILFRRRIKFWYKLISIHIWTDNFVFLKEPSLICQLWFLLFPDWITFMSTIRLFNILRGILTESTLWNFPKSFNFWDEVLITQPLLLFEIDRETLSMKRNRHYDHVILNWVSVMSIYIPQPYREIKVVHGSVLRVENYTV